MRARWIRGFYLKLRGYEQTVEGLWFKRCASGFCDVGITRYNGIPIWTRSAKAGELMRICGWCSARTTAGYPPRRVAL